MTCFFFIACFSPRSEKTFFFFGLPIFFFFFLPPPVGTFFFGFLFVFFRSGGVVYLRQKTRQRATIAGADNKKGHKREVSLFFLRLERCSCRSTVVVVVAIFRCFRRVFGLASEKKRAWAGKGEERGGDEGGVGGGTHACYDAAG